MPPEQQGMGAAMMAALAGKACRGALGALAGSMFGMKDTGALFVELLQSGTIRGQLVDRFDLQKVYWKRYRQDAVKKLAHRTEITQDRKSGVITIVVTDTDRQRARDMAQAYLEQLDNLLIKVNTSAARREREFIEQRLVTVQSDLEKAQVELSDFASKNTTLDIKEQTKAMVEAGAKLQAQLIVARVRSRSLGQIYGEGNVRMRAANARVGELERELKKLGGSGAASSGDESDNKASSIHRCARCPSWRCAGPTLPAGEDQGDCLRTADRTVRTGQDRGSEVDSQCASDRPAELAGEEIVSSATHHDAGLHRPVRFW